MPSGILLTVEWNTKWNTFNGGVEYQVEYF
nr:MAG TPA: hypothetical protein [Bacteriophage sp.]